MMYSLFEINHSWFISIYMVPELLTFLTLYNFRSPSVDYFSFGSPFQPLCRQIPQPILQSPLTQQVKNRWAPLPSFWWRIFFSTDNNPQIKWAELSSVGSISQDRDLRSWKAWISYWWPTCASAVWPNIQHLDGRELYCSCLALQFNGAQYQ